MALSRPLIYGLLGSAVIAAAVFLNNGEPQKTSKYSSSTKPSAKKKPEVNWDFPATETSLHFEKPQGRIRNIFAPLISEEKAAKPDQDQIMKIPSNMAAGEADWAYTGMVEVDGRKMALLENGSTHQGGYVKEGETWKKSRVDLITLASITVTGPDGSSETVFRYNPNATPKPKPPPDPGFRPMDLSRALNGPIGVEISRSAPEADPPASKKPKRQPALSGDHP